MRFLYNTLSLFLALFLCFLSALSPALSKKKAIKAQDACSPHIAAAAKKYGIPHHFLWGLAYVESNHRGIPWAWALNVSGRSHYLNSQKEAERFLKDLSQRKLTYTDIGCMQINYKFHRRAFKSVTQMLDPKQNILYGAQFLKKLYKKSKNWKEAIGNYNSKRKSTSAQKTRRKKYIDKVIMASKKKK